MSPPVPVNETVAGASAQVELTESWPLMTPPDSGVKVTPTEHVAPPARLDGQVLPVRPKEEETARLKPVAAALLLFVIVTV